MSKCAKISDGIFYIYSIELFQKEFSYLIRIAEGYSLARAEIIMIFEKLRAKSLSILPFI